MSPEPGIKVADLYGTGPAILSDEPRYEWRPVSIAPNVTCVAGKAYQTQYSKYVSEVISP